MGAVDVDSDGFAVGVVGVCPRFVLDAGSVCVVGALLGALTVLLLCAAGVLEKLGAGDGDGDGDDTWTDAAGAGAGAGGGAGVDVVVECCAQTKEERRTSAKQRLESRIQHLLPADPIGSEYPRSVGSL